MLAAFAVRQPIDRIITMCLAMPLLIGAAKADSLRQGIGVLCAVFAAHSGVVIGLTVLAPDRIAALLPFGQTYWHESHHWIVSGVNPEYELSSWVPAHAIALFGVPLLSYISLGGVLLLNGLFQVDMMNVYVGNLISTSHNPFIALGLGWHPWSVTRGIGFLVLGFEAVSWSLQRMTHTIISSPRRRTARCCLGVGFLLLDATVKLTLMETVRSILNSNLISTGA